MKSCFRAVSAFIFLFAFLTKAYAVCPLCTFVAAGGVGISRYFGVDDTISGVWIGGIILSAGLWTAHSLKTRNYKFPLLGLWVVAIFYIITILPLYSLHMVGLPGNTLWNTDKLLLGVMIGSVLYIIGVISDVALRATNDCKVYFYYQRVILPISCLLLATIFFI